MIRGIARYATRRTLGATPRRVKLARKVARNKGKGFAKDAAGEVKATVRSNRWLRRYRMVRRIFRLA